MADENIMQTCECKVALADSKTSVLRRNITPAEAIILQEIHGPQAIVEPVQQENIERTTIEEKINLRSKYDRPNREVVEKMFPGHDPRIPMTFKEAGIEIQLAPTQKRAKGNITTLTGGKADLKSSKKDMKKAIETAPVEESTVEKID